MNNQKLKGFKKRARKLCHKLHSGQTGNCKRTTFDHQQYHPTLNQDNQTPSVAIRIPHQDHSPTKAEVKKTNQLLLDDNQHLKKTSTKPSIASRLSLLTKRICNVAFGLSQRPPTN
jgi:hypothetical protein